MLSRLQGVLVTLGSDSTLGSHSRPGSDEADALLARARFAEGDLEGARTMAERLLARHGEDVGSLSLLAQIALTRGELVHGLSLARRALRVDPFDAEAISILDRLREVRP